MGWLAGWGDRQSHTLTGTAVGAQTLYQVGIKVYYGAGVDGTEVVNGVTFGKVYCDSECETDFGDIRFTETDEETLLHYCLLEKVDSDYAIFWVEVDAIPISPNTDVIYMYYGKAAEATTSSGADTFPSLFDHFVGDAEPPAGWSENNINGGLTWSDLSADSKYKVYNFQDSSAAWHGNEIYKAATPPTTFALVAKHIVVCGPTDKPQHESTLKGYFSGAEKFLIGFQDSWTAAIGAIRSVITETDDSEAGDTRVGATFVFDLRRDGTNVKTYWNGNLQQTKVETDTLDEVRFRLVGAASVSSSNPQTELEYVFIRKFVDAEPTHTSWGSREGIRTIDLPAEFDVRHPASEDLPAQFEVGQGSEELPAQFEVGQGSEGLSAKLIVRHSAPAWLGGWRHRKSHTLTGTAAGAQTLYQVGIKVYYGAGVDGTEVVNGATFGKVYCDSKCKTDFGDIRFTKTDETSLLDFWIQEQVDSDYALIWVEVDAIPASPDTDLIYMYYGNAGASTTSSITDTFIFGEDFELGNLSRWTAAGASWSDQGTTVKHGSWAAQGVAHATDRLLEKTISEVSKARVMFYTRCAVSADLKKFYTFRPQGTQYIMVMHNGHFQYYDGAYKNYPTDTAYAINTWYKVTLLLDYDTDKFKVYIDNGYKGEVATVLTGAGLNDLEHVASSTTHPNTGYLDDVCVAKYVDPEPTHTSWGSEEGTQTDLPAEFVVRQAVILDLPAQFEVGQGSEELPAQFFIGALAGSEDLFGAFDVRQESAVDLAAEFFIALSGSEDLLGEFDVQHEASEDLLGEFYVGQSGSADLPGEFFVRNADIGDLFGVFDVRQEASTDLAAEFIVARPGATELLGEFIVQQEASVELLAEFDVRQEASVDLLSEFVVRQETSAELLGEFVIRHTSTEDLLGVFNVRQETSVELLVEFIIRQEVSVDLLGEFVIRRAAIRDLPAQFEVGQGAEDLPGEFVIRKTATLSLAGSFTVKHTATVELAAELIVQQAAISDLRAFFWVNYYSVDLLAGFNVRQSSSRATDFTIIDNTRGLTVEDADREMTVTPRRRMRVK